MNIVDRIKEIIEYKQISTRKFCIEIGVANGFFDKVKDVGSEKVLKILNTYPDIDPEWLISGNGKMIRSELKKNTQSNTDHYNILLNRFEILVSENAVLKYRLNEYEKGKKPIPYKADKTDQFLVSEPDPENQ